MNSVPIIDVHPYLPRSCAILGRVTVKGELRSWTKHDTEGTVFSFNVLDETSEIKVICFNEVAELFYGMIEVDRIYSISKFNAASSNPAFSGLQHPFEITLTTESSVRESVENVASAAVPDIKFVFTPISEIGSRSLNSLIDIIGVVHRQSDGIQIQRRDGSHVFMKELYLYDEANVEIGITVWGHLAENLNCSIGQVLAARKVKVGEQHGRNLSTTGYSTLIVAPEREEAYRLLRWNSTRDTNTPLVPYHSSSFLPYSSMKLLAEVNFNDCIGTLVKVKGTFVNVCRDRSIYKSCGMDYCKKKLSPCGRGVYFCQKCNQRCMTYTWTLLLKATFADMSNSVQVTCFNDIAQRLLSTTAESLGETFERDPSSYYDCLEKNQNLHKSYILILEPRNINYCGIPQIEVVLKDFYAIDHKRYAKLLLSEMYCTI